MKMAAGEKERGNRRDIEKEREEKVEITLRSMNRRNEKKGERK